MGWVNGLLSYVAENVVGQLLTEQLVLELLVVHWYPLGRVRLYEQLGFIMMLFELASPGNVAGLGEHPETVIVCGDPPYVVSSVAFMG